MLDFTLLAKVELPMSLSIRYYSIRKHSPCPTASQYEEHASAAGTKAFLYTNGTMKDLNSLVSGLHGLSLQSTNSVSNGVYITGHGLVNGNEDAFLLIPNAVPTPSSLVVFGIGIGGLLVRRRKSVSFPGVRKRIPVELPFCLN